MPAFLNDDGTTTQYQTGSYIDSQIKSGKLKVKVIGGDRNVAKWKHKIISGMNDKVMKKLNDTPNNIIFKVLTVRPIDAKTVMVYGVWTEKDDNYSKPQVGGDF